LMGQLSAAVNDRAAFETFVDVDRTDIAAMQAKKKLFRDAMPLLVQLGAKQEMLDELELLRKRIHNIVEDMKGSIRVFCRVRPMCKKETEEGDKDIMERVDRTPRIPISRISASTPSSWRTLRKRTSSRIRKISCSPPWTATTSPSSRTGRQAPARPTR